MFIAVVTIFAICWLPYHLFYVYAYHNPHITSTNITPHLFLSFYWLAMANSMVNPIIYYWMNRRFRHYFQRILCFCCFRLWKMDDSFIQQNSLSFQRKPRLSKFLNLLCPFPSSISSCFSFQFNFSTAVAANFNTENKSIVFTTYFFIESVCTAQIFISFHVRTMHDCYHAAFFRFLKNVTSITSYLSHSQCIRKLFGLFRQEKMSHFKLSYHIQEYREEF